MSYQTILVEQREAVALIALNRTQALDLLNTQVLADLIDAFAERNAEPEQRRLVLKKEMVNLAFETRLMQGLYRAPLFHRLTAAEAKAEGMPAFLVKRPAVGKER